MQDYRKIVTWQRAHALAQAVYGLTRALPSDELYGLTSQLRRAVVSVETNIAEGAKRDSRVEYARFLNVAEASLAEVLSLLGTASDTRKLDPATVKPVIQEARRIALMLSRLRGAVLAYEARSAGP